VREMGIAKHLLTRVKRGPEIVHARNVVIRTQVWYVEPTLTKL
jgi:hypothetical protein